MSSPTVSCHVEGPCSAGATTASARVGTVELDRPVAHSWSPFQKFRRKFCNVCRKKMDDRTGARCVICKYYAHKRCIPISQPICKRVADYNTFVTPDEHSLTRHQWMEGNLKTSDKCTACNQACGTSDSLSGMRCLWCMATMHTACQRQADQRCVGGILRNLLLPSYSVYCPRLTADKELELTPLVVPKQDSGDRLQGQTPSSVGELDFVDESALDTHSILEDAMSVAAEFVILRVYDSGLSDYRKVMVMPDASPEVMLSACLVEFHIDEDDAADFCLVLETAPSTYEPVCKVAGDLEATDKLVFRSKDDHLSQIRIYMSWNNEKIQCVTLSVLPTMSSDEVVSLAIEKFRLIIPEWHRKNYALVEFNMYDGVTERVLDSGEKPWKIMRDYARISVQQLQMVRLYLRNISMDLPVTLYVGNLPRSWGEERTVTRMKEVLSPVVDQVTFGAAFHRLGCMFIEVHNPEVARQVCMLLRASVFADDNTPKVFRIPTIQEEVLSQDSSPLLTFVNERSGGGQGAELQSQLIRLLNPYQVFNLSHGGPLPGLFAFRKLKSFRILVAGGDGTVGWVLSQMDSMKHLFTCSTPSVAVIPLGTGNDLARVLRWGAGFSGESAITILEGMEESLVVPLDRWNIDFTGGVSEDAAAANAEDGVAHSSFVMNNYLGIGVEAEIALKFHLAREKNPEKFNSRLHNKGVYLQKSIGKMIQRSGGDAPDDLSKSLTLEVDKQMIKIPSGTEGIIVLNIKSWMAGADGWGSEKDEKFKPPSMNDGLLEVIGVQGVMHLGQIQGGMRTGIRLAQGADITMIMTCAAPVEIDGEPFMQQSCLCRITQGRSMHMMRRHKKQLASDSHTSGPKDVKESHSHGPSLRASFRSRQSSKH